MKGLCWLCVVCFQIAAVNAQEVLYSSGFPAGGGQQSLYGGPGSLTCGPEYYQPGLGASLCGPQQPCRRPHCQNQCCRDRCEDQLGCRDLYLFCFSGRGTFVLKCDGCGFANYVMDGCAQAAKLVEQHKDNEFVYYQEENSGIRWAFSRRCEGGYYAIWVTCQRRNPLDCEWRRFCTAGRR